MLVCCDLRALCIFKYYENESWANYFTLAKTVSIKYYSAEKLPSSPHQHHRLRESALRSGCYLLGNWHTPGSGCQKTGTAAAWIAPLPPRALYHWCWRAIGRAPAHAARPHDANDRRGEARAWKGCSIRETFTPLPGAAWSTAGGPSNGQRGMLVIRAQRTGGGRVGAKAWATVLPAGRPCPRPCAVRACTCVREWVGESESVCSV